MPDAKAPLPALDPGSTAFWTGGAIGELLICRFVRQAVLGSIPGLDLDGGS
jgi:hypothetical protein